MNDHSEYLTVMSKVFKDLAHIIDRTPHDFFHTNNATQNLVSSMDIFPGVINIQEVCTMGLFNLTLNDSGIKLELIHCGGVREIVGRMGRHLGSKHLQ